MAAELVQLVRRRRPGPSRSPATGLAFFLSVLRRASSATAVPPPRYGERAGKWLALPPFKTIIDPSSVGKAIMGQRSAGKDEPTTALKWVRRCCPQLPVSLVHKLFRLRQVRKELMIPTNTGVQAEGQQVKRVSAKDVIGSGDVILLPVSVQESISAKYNIINSEEEINFIRSLELYKDPAVIVVNKPPGMPVQGGVGIKNSMDMLAANSLKYDFSESPRLVHRLDRDSSGVLVLGRTQSSTSILHSIFREKTSGAFSNDLKSTLRTLQRKYWALVIGTPRCSKGLISAPLGKIVIENGKSERITIVDDTKSTLSQPALTEYKVIRSSNHGYTWLELTPLTGRKHQLRVHCAEVLRTPIVGDYKYGWHAHRKWEPITSLNPIKHQGKHPKQQLPFGLEFEAGSISEKQPYLHLHCRQMILPDISVALESLQSPSSHHDLLRLQKLDLVAPLPFHMQMSWDILGY